MGSLRERPPREPVADCAFGVPSAESWSWLRPSPKHMLNQVHPDLSRSPASSALPPSPNVGRSPPGRGTQAQGRPVRGFPSAPRPRRGGQPERLCVGHPSVCDPGRQAAEPGTRAHGPFVRGSPSPSGPADAGRGKGRAGLRAPEPPSPRGAGGGPLGAPRRRPLQLWRLVHRLEGGGAPSSGSPRGSEAAHLAGGGGLEAERTDLPLRGAGRPGSRARRRKPVHAGSTRLVTPVAAERGPTASAGLEVSQKAGPVAHRGENVLPARSLARSGRCGLPRTAGGTCADSRSHQAPGCQRAASIRDLRAPAGRERRRPRGDARRCQGSSLRPLHHPSTRQRSQTPHLFFETSGGRPVFDRRLAGPRESMVGKNGGGDSPSG